MNKRILDKNLYPILGHVNESEVTSCDNSIRVKRFTTAPKKVVLRKTTSQPTLFYKGVVKLLDFFLI